ncbi:MAG: hypothetical protein K9L30_09850 [Desulfobacterales bacterium]|nr:hypothetical protein [Desulfobacterales bacterium]
MDPLSLIPSPDALPVSYGWLKALLLSTFTLHIVFMNIMVGSCIVALFSGQGKYDAANTPSVQNDLTGKLTFIVAFTINLGVAPLLFLQVLYGNFFYTSSVLMASYWLSVIPLLIIAYYSVYISKMKFQSPGPRWRFLMWLTTAIFLIIGFLFSSNMTMMLRPDTWSAYFSAPGGTILNLGDKTLWPRYLHFMTASIAAGGLFSAFLGNQRLKKGLAGNDKRIAAGMKWFTHATMLQLVIGTWFLMSLPSHISRQFIGGNTTATILFTLGFAAAIVAIFFGYKKKVRLSSVMFLITVILMVLMRDLLRTAFLKPYISLSDIPVTNDYLPMFIFIISLVIGIGVMVYMLRLTATAVKKQQNM